MFCFCSRRALSLAVGKVMEFFGLIPCGLMNGFGHGMHF